MYFVYGKEVGDAGILHLQGTLCFAGPRSPSSVNAIFDSKAYISPTRDLAFSIRYCKKEGCYTELGIAPASKGQGVRSDLQALSFAICNGETDRKRLREEFPDVCAKYFRFVSSVIFDTLPDVVVETHFLWVWQQQLHG